MSGLGRVFLAGHRGMVGQALARHLSHHEVEVITRPRMLVDLRDARAVRHLLIRERPDTVILAAARVGGIGANAADPVGFLCDNLAIAQSVIPAALEAGVERLLNLGSSCIYPRACAQPIAEEALLTGRLEPTNEGYALAKIAAIRLCEAINRQHGTDYRTVMPYNLYGPGDCFDPERAHVLPAMIRRFAGAEREAPVTIWGSGTPRREFLHVDDMAAASLFVMALPRPVWEGVTAPDRRFLNVGAGEDLSILELARLVARATGHRGEIRTDPTRPDGTPRKLLDTRRLHSLGWRPRISLREGIAATLNWYRRHGDTRRLERLG